MVQIETEMITNAERNVSLKERTWIHRGGIVGTWIRPCSLEELENEVAYLYDNKANFLTIGHTSNIYFKNSFNIDYIVDIRNLKKIDEKENDLIVCECGTPMKNLAHYCIEHGYAGYEGFIDLPGTVAGAVVNNSGCFGSSIKKVLRGIDIVMSDGIKHLKTADLLYSFRTSALKEGLIKGCITKVYFDTSNKASVDELQQRANQFHKQRVLTQDSPARNLGSTVNMSGDVRGVRGLLIKVIRRIMIYLKLYPRFTEIFPGLVCLLYFKPFVAKYISKRNLNCFIWKDDGADKAFPKYMHIIKHLYKNISTEIQIFE